MRCLRFAAEVIFVLFALPAAAQLWPCPENKSPAPVRSTSCVGIDEAVKTWQYGWPLAAHTGRYIDSSSTGNVQNVGMRTVRARRIRLNRDANRIYIALGEAIGVYKLDEFFTATLKVPMQTPASMPTGAEVKNRFPLEEVLRPYQFFYGECKVFGCWTYESLDIQETLLDFDGDDRGYLYIGHKYGWGLAKENEPLYAGAHMEKLFQLRPSIEANSVFSLKVDGQYYAVVSQNSASAGKMRIYNVTDPAVPYDHAVHETPNDKYGIAEWSKDNARQILALVNTDGHVRIYDFRTYVADGEPLADYPPTGGRKFTGVAVDEDGAVWFTSTDTQITSNVLYRATPAAGGYSRHAFADAYGGNFSPVALHAGGGWVAVGGRSALDTYELAGDMRLFKVTEGVPVPVPDYGFFRKYYDVAPATFAAPTTHYSPSYIGLRGLKLVPQGTKVYLMYGTTGLGDVYELANSDTRVPTSITFRTEIGSAVHLIATVKASSAGAMPMSGVVSFTKNGIPLASAEVAATTDPLTFVVDLPRTDLDTVATLSATYEGDELYKSTGPVSLLLTPPIPAPAAFNAVATTPTTVQLEWSNVPGPSQYEVQRKSSGADWSVIATTNISTYVDSSVTANQAYLYRVRAVLVGSIGLFSATELASTHVFTDDPLTSGTAIKVAHVNELRSAIDAARALAGLPAFPFTDATLARGATIRAVHVAELRLADAQLHATLGLASLLPATPFSRNDINILRDGIR